MEPLHVVAGSITVLRLYDVAYAIDLGRVEQLVRQPAGRVRLRRAEPKAIAFDRPPVEFSFGTEPIQLAGSPHNAEVNVRVYDFGAITIALRVNVAGESWDTFVTATNELTRIVSGEAGARRNRELLDRVHALIEPALTRPVVSGLVEDYLLATVNRFDRPIDAEEVLAQLDLTTILSGEAQPLSAASRKELLRHSYSYYVNDLVVLTWDRAFILEPAGDTDIADIIELANAQLLELRYYDDLLDDELPRMYDRVAEARRALRGLGRRRYAALARDLHTLVAEVTEITERVENALKVTEDVYLARIYGAALELFRISSWSATVDRKLAIVRETYTALYDEATSGRAELLEAAIVLLIIFEIVLAFL